MSQALLTTGVGRVRPVVLSASVVCAFLDVAPVFLYVINRSPVHYYILTVLAKLAMVVMLRLPASRYLVRNWPFLMYLALLGLFDLAWLDVPLSAALQLLGFVVEIWLTLAIVRREQLRGYFAVYAVALAVNFAIFLCMIKLGRVPSHFGRYYYYDGFQPNLGAEIAAVGVACAALALDTKWFLLCGTLDAISIFLLEGRSAILLTVGITVLMLGRAAYRIVKRLQFTGMAVLVFGLAGLCLGGAMLAPIVVHGVDAALLLNNPYRGTSSGFSGRTEGWQNAIIAFLEAPVTGAGTGYFDTRKLLPPHNLLLFLGAQFGVFAVPMLLLLVMKYWRLWRVNPWWFLLWLQFAPLLMFNDRSFNLNPYPYVFYLLLFSV